MSDEEFLEQNSEIIERGGPEEIVDLIQSNDIHLGHLPSYYLLPIVVYRNFDIEFVYSPEAAFGSRLVLPNYRGSRLTIFNKIEGIGENPKRVLEDYLYRKKFKTPLIDKLLKQVKVVRV